MLSRCKVLRWLIIFCEVMVERVRTSVVEEESQILGVPMKLWRTMYYYCCRYGRQWPQCSCVRTAGVLSVVVLQQQTVQRRDRTSRGRYWSCVQKQQQAANKSPSLADSASVGHVMALLPLLLLLLTVGCRKHSLMVQMFPSFLHDRHVDDTTIGADTVFPSIPVPATTICLQPPSYQRPIFAVHHRTVGGLQPSKTEYLWGRFLIQ